MTATMTPDTTSLAPLQTDLYKNIRKVHICWVMVLVLLMMAGLAFRSREVFYNSFL